MRLGKSHDRYERFAENSFVRGLIQPRTSCLSSPSGIAVTSVANAERNPSSATGVPTSGLPFIMRTCSVLFKVFNSLRALFSFICFTNLLFCFI